MKKITSENIRHYFPDYQTLKPGEWSKCSISLPYGSNPWERVEIGLYREPVENEEYAERYTLQIFNGDDVMVCEDVEVA